jgi:CRISPR-associated endonuclease/helicase Cas3
MSSERFQHQFTSLTNHSPFPWQVALYERFLRNEIPPSCNLPTGLGKTSVIAVWLIALANGANAPRRLVYVVNRRTVVDQTTEEVEKYKRNKSSDIPDFAISTLRGQFADNREWSADPSRPAVICGTVDMIGSRLLFSGYGVGWKSKPLHAGFLGQDVLLVHDEAHLEPAFQKLIKSIEAEQQREPEVPWPKFRVMELTATSRGDGEVFGLGDEDHLNETVNARVNAAKKLQLHELADANKPQKELIDKALTFKESGKAVLIFATTVESVLAVQDALDKAKLKVKVLTGTMRGLERDRLVEDDVFKRFLPNASSGSETVYLVCTSAGEVGVNISADHLICDLSTFESMAQRFGRVNRFGKFAECEVHVYYPTKWDEKHALTIPRQKTLDLLRKLEGNNVSPSKLSELPASDRQAAFAPEPTILPATDILFDAWALTSIRDKLPGRPKVEPYLHGITDWEPPQTQVAWREEVGEITGDLLQNYDPQELLDDYPLKPHELLKEPSYRAFKHFETMAKRLEGTEIPVWLVADDGTIEVLSLATLADKDQKDRINGMKVLLPPSAGGLEAGMLNGTAVTASDVADEWFLKNGEGELIRKRKRLWLTSKESEGDIDDMHSVRKIVLTATDADEEESVWEWFVLDNEGEKTAKKPVEWQVHVNDVVAGLNRILANLPLSAEVNKAITVAAEFHDHGKRRKLFQTVLGNTGWPNVILAKSGKHGGRIQELYRHEFGSLVDIEQQKLLSQVPAEHQDLVMHLIAAHHGRARPHFSAEEAFDPEGPIDLTDRISREVPRRFAKLQRKYGRWGLAYLESILRAADWAASSNPSAFLEVGK